MSIDYIKLYVCRLFENMFCGFGSEFTIFTVNEETRIGIIVSWFFHGYFVAHVENKHMTKINDGNPRRVRSEKTHKDTQE